MEAPTPHRVRTLAEQGLSVDMIAAKFDMYTHEFEKHLKKNKDLKRAYDLGCVDLQSKLYTELMCNKDSTTLMLKLRLFAQLNDPVAENLSGDLLKVLLAKADKSTRQTLSQLLKKNK